MRFLIAAVDVQGGQDRRFVVQVLGYGPQLKIWLIDRFSLRHLDDADHTRLDMHAQVEHWGVLITQVMDRTYPLADGSGRHPPIYLTVCDSGGEAGITDRAYDFYRQLRRQGLARRFMLVKGVTSRTAPKLEERFPDTSKRKDRKAGSRGDVPVWFLNTDALKDIVNNNLGRTAPGPGHMHMRTVTMNTSMSILATSITGVRVVCTRCRAAFIIPLGAKDAPAKCFNCYTALPGPELVRGLVRELTWLNQAVSEVEVSFDAAIEGALITSSGWASHTRQPTRSSASTRHRP